MNVRGLMAAAVVAAPLVACSSDTTVEPGPATPTGVEAIARDHLPEPTSAAEASYDGSDPEDTVGARLTHGDEHVDVVVGPPRDQTLAAACADGVVSCASIDTDVDGGTLTLAWQEVVPEEDPGIIVLVLERGDEFSLVRWGGDIRVTADPRELELEVPVEDAVDLLEDPRLRLVVPEDWETHAGPATSR